MQLEAVQAEQAAHQERQVQQAPVEQAAAAVHCRRIQSCL